MSGAAHPAVFHVPGVRPHAGRPSAGLALPPVTRQRTKLWELNPSIHCSIIGTCLTAGELRRTMAKLPGHGAADATDHDLHSEAVGLCTHHGPAARLLHKALDKRHELATKRFARLRGEAEVLQAWAEARRDGDIPGAYWAVVTHPELGHAGLRRAFGDVHMLSHLIGSANRADIRRLTALEAENAALREKLDRQQGRLHEAITARDSAINRLGVLAAARTDPGPAPQEAEYVALRHVAAGLQASLSRESARCARLDAKLTEAMDAARAGAKREAAAQAQAAAMQGELLALERLPSAPSAAAVVPSRILYVGGFPGVVAQIRALLEAAGGALLAHDGGRHDGASLLPGLIGQADRVVFPVDCISHEAVLTIKRHCRQLGTPYVPLRSAGLGSFLAAVAAPRELHEAASGTPAPG